MICGVPTVPCSTFIVKAFDERVIPEAYTMSEGAVVWTLAALIVAETVRDDPSTPEAVKVDIHVPLLLLVTVPKVPALVPSPVNVNATVGFPVPVVSELP